MLANARSNLSIPVNKNMTFVAIYVVAYRKDLSLDYIEGSPVRASVYTILVV